MYIAIESASDVTLGKLGGDLIHDFTLHEQNGPAISLIQRKDVSLTAEPKPSRAWQKSYMVEGRCDQHVGDVDAARAADPQKNGVLLLNLSAALGGATADAVAAAFLDIEPAEALFARNC
jgi:hypothetical protein